MTMTMQTPMAVRSPPLEAQPAPAPLDHRDDIDGFRAGLRRWLDAVVPPDWQDRLAESPDGYEAFQRWWYEELRKVGLTAPHWPREWGGVAISLRHRVVIYEEMARANAPQAEMFGISLYHLPATLFAHGTAVQRERYLTGVKERGEVWCQGFSEPGSGSDLASLRTRAERKNIDGRDVYVVNGQKIWSSYGMFADYYLLLARTDPDAPRKQMGISYFIMDMKSPGVTIRPIRQITGEAEFAEVFLDNVEIPVENRLGAENEGWMIAQSTLATERGLMLFEASERMASAFERLGRAGQATWWHNKETQRHYIRLYTEMRAARLLVRRMLNEIEADAHADVMEIATYIKLHYATLLQKYNDFVLLLAGLDGQILEKPVNGSGHHSGRPMIDYMRAFTWTISGGSNEIMRNIIAERVLLLPR